MQELSLSYVQQRLWMEWKLQPLNHAYNNPLLYQLEGELQPGLLEKAIAYVVAKRAALRTQFFEKGGIPYQLIHESVSINFEYYDVSQLTKSEREQEQERLLDNNVRRPFDLYRMPLFRFTLIKKQTKQFFFILNIHHIVVDGYSATLLLQDISYAYEQYRAQQAISIDRDDAYYIKYINQEQTRFEPSTIIASKKYWQAALQDIEHHIVLAPQAHHHNQSFAGWRIHFSLPREIKDAVKRAAKEYKTTNFLYLLSVLNVLLYKYTGQRRLAIGYPTDMRGKEFRSLFGCFINNLPLATELPANATFTNILNAVKTQRRQDKQFENIPMQVVLDAARQNKGELEQLFNMSFIRANFALIGLEFDSVAVIPIPVFTHATKDDLSLLYDESDGLEFEIEYRKSLYDDQFIKRFIQHFKELLAYLLAYPNTVIDTISLISDPEKEWLNSNFNRLQSNELKVNSFIKWFEVAASKFHHKAAVTADNTILDYQSLNQRANQFARQLQQIGISRGDRVAICLNRHSDLLVSLLGIQKLGAVYVPLDSNHPVDRLAYIISQAKVKFSLVEQATKAIMAHADCMIITLELLQSKASNYASDNLAIELSLDDPAYMIYTSGSTGNPKGVVVKQRGLVNFLESMIEIITLNPDDRLLALTTIAFDISGLELYLPLLVGAQVVLADKQSISDGQRLKQLIDQHEINVMQATPATWQLLLDSGWSGKNTLTALCGGETLPKELANELRPLVSTFWNLYGPTETTIWSMAEKIVPGRPINLGQPLHNTAIYLLDEHLNQVPIGVVGEIYIAGDGLAAGYFQHTDLTDAAFVTWSKANNLRLYKTGDLGVITRNNGLQYLGRKDNQIKLRGFRIELSEIETCLAAYSDIHQCAVVLQMLADNDQRIIAFYVSKSGEKLSRELLQRHLQQTIPAYMMPAHYVCLDVMPLTPSKKIDRKLLAKNNINVDTTTQYQAPETITEIKLQKIWQRLLHNDRISINENFFSIGGHSLMANQLLAEVGDEFQVSMPLGKFFEAPTIAYLAHYISSATKTDLTITATPRQFGATLPLSFSQQRFWFLNQFQADIGQYNLAFAIQFNENIELKHLEQALQTIIDRHEALRTCFIRSEDDLPYQYIVDHMTWSLALHAVADDDAANKLCETMASQPFELNHFPLFRFVLVKVSGQSPKLLCVFHHIIFDGFSINIFVKQLFNCLPVNNKTRRDQNQQFSIQYADYTLWYRKYIESNDYQKQLNNWRQELKGCPVIVLASDYPRPKKLAFTGDEIQLELPNDLVKGILANNKRYGLTSFIQLLAAFYILVHQETAQHDLCVGVPVDGRIIKELQPLLGCFINTLPLRVNLSDNPSYADLLQRVKSVSIRAIDQQHVPFEVLVEALDLPRTLSINPLFNMMFNLQEFNLGDEFSSVTMPKLERVNTHASKYDLTFDVYVENKAMSVTVQYATHLFKTETITNLVKNYQAILQTAVADIYVKLDQLINSQQRQALTKTYYQQSIQENKWQNYVAPKTKMQTIIANKWQHILHIDQIGLHDNFFFLGGHSLLATKLIATINREWNIRLPLYTIFEADNLEQFVFLVEQSINCSSKNAQLSQQDLLSLKLDTYPLADKYLGMIYLYERSINKEFYNVSVAIKLIGELDAKILDSAINKIIARHDALRTYFIRKNKSYTANVLSSLRAHIELIEKEEQLNQAQITDLCKQLARKPIELNQPPLWRLYQINFSSKQTILIFVAHHIITDEWSLDIFANELAEYYSYQQIKKDCLQFAHYNHFLINYQASAQYKQDLAYWEAQLSNAKATSLLKFQDDTTSQAGCGYLTSIISKYELERFREHVQMNHKTIFLHLLTAFKCLLSRYTEQLDICIGSILANRSDYQFEQTMGFFVDNLALRTLFSNEDCFLSALKKVERTLSQAYSHSGLTYSNVVAQYRKHHQDLLDEPIRIMFVMNHPYITPQFDGLKAELIEPFNAGSEYELVFALRELPSNDIEVKVEYYGIYTREFVSEFIENYINFIHHCVSHPKKSIKLGPILSRSKYCEQFNKERFKFSQSTETIPEVFYSICQQYGNHTAIYYRLEKINYRQLYKLTDQLALLIKNLLAKSQKLLKPDIIIAVSIPPSIFYVQTIIAICKLGASFLPIDILTPRERIQYILQDSQAVMFITDEKNLKNINPGETIIVTQARIEKTLKSFYSETKLNYNHLSPVTLAYIIYTSGTSGTPKGVMLEHHSLINFVNAIKTMMNLSHHDRMLQFSSIGFDASVWEIFIALLNGASLYIPDESERMIAKPLQDFINYHKLTAGILPPSLLHHLDANKLPSLQKLAVGGDKCQLNIVHEWGKGRSLFNAYGPTEATICTTIAKLNSNDKAVTIGRPINNMDVLLLNEQLQPVPKGCVGEIYITGVGLARGYLDAELTGLSFIEITINEHKLRCYRTGDLARYNSNNELIYLGRKDRQVKVNGLRIELLEIENCFIKETSAKQAHVLVDSTNNRIQLYYIAEKAIDLHQALGKLRKKLPTYMVPNLLIHLNEFPLTVNGKINDDMLKKIDTSSIEVIKQKQMKFSLSETEQKVLSCWSQIINKPISNIKEDFFILGGNSLQVMQIIAELNNQFNICITMKTFFNNPTIFELSKYIDSQISHNCAV